MTDVPSSSAVVFNSRKFERKITMGSSAVHKTYQSYRARQDSGRALLVHHFSQYLVIAELPKLEAPPPLKEQEGHQDRELGGLRAELPPQYRPPSGPLELEPLLRCRLLL